MSALDPAKVDEIRDALSEAADDLEYDHPDEVIHALTVILGEDTFTGIDGAIIERVIDRLEQIALAMLNVQTMLKTAPFTFGKLNDWDAE